MRLVTLAMARSEPAQGVAAQARVRAGAVAGAAGVAASLNPQKLERRRRFGTFEEFFQQGNDGYGLDQVVVPARLVTVHPSGTSTETPLGASWGFRPSTGAPFPVPTISTGRESLSAPSEDARQTCPVVAVVLLFAAVNVLRGMVYFPETVMTCDSGEGEVQDSAAQRRAIAPRARRILSTTLSFWTWRSSSGRTCNTREDVAIRLCA